MTDTTETELRPNILFPNINPDPCEWEKVPGSVKDKLRTLRRARDDARAMLRGVLDEQRTSRDARQAAQMRLQQISFSKDDPPWAQRSHDTIEPLPPDHPEMKAVTKRIADADAELKRLAPIITARTTAVEQLARLVGALEDYLRALNGIAIPLFKGPAPKLDKKTATLEAVEQIRQRIKKLNAERDRIAAAPVPSAVAKQRARAEIARLVERGRPSVHALLAPEGSTITWAERPYREAVVAGRAIVNELDPAAFPVTVWLHERALIERIEAEIDAIADDKAALSAEQRREQLAKIDAELLANGRNEETFVEAAIAGGINVTRRPEADPRAVLGLGNDMPPQR